MDLAGPLTYLITKGDLTPENCEQQKRELLRTIDGAVRAGISMIQLREKNATARQLFELTREAVSIVGGSQMKILVNGRPDIGAAAGAHGVQLPENGLPVAQVRRTFPSPFLIGASVHSLEAARSARSDGADFVVFGPIFDTGEKEGKGTDELHAVCAAMGEFPVIAVGGIDDRNREDVLNAGARGYASIRYFNDQFRSDV